MKPILHAPGIYFGMTAESGPRKDLFRLPNARYGYAVDEVEREVAIVLSTEVAQTPARQIAGTACAVIHDDVVRRFALRSVPVAGDATTGISPAAMGRQAR